MPKVSVIIPCLNMSKYISQCLDTIIHQTLTNIEILLIDAGSTDGTIEILNAYAKKDSRFYIFSSDKKSYGYQVNIGISNATGDYISIIDADDRISLDMYEVLYQVIETSGADYVKGTAKGFYTLSNKEYYYFPISPFGPEEYNTGIELAPKDTPSLLTKDNFLWYGLYRSDFIKQIRLHESPGAAFQDFGALFQIQTRAKKAIYIDRTVYFYRQDNINASTYNKKGFSFVANEYAYAQKYLTGLSSEWKTSFYRKLFLHFMDRLYAMVDSGEFWEETLSDMIEIAQRLHTANEDGILQKNDLTDKQWADLQLLWESPYLLYQKYQKIYEPKREDLKKVFQHVKHKKGVIFGSGKYGCFLHKQFLYRGWNNVIAYCDNKTSVQGELQHGIEILSPEQAVARCSDAKYIIANKYYAEDMKEQLKILGIRDSAIIIYTAGIDKNLFGAIID